MGCLANARTQPSPPLCAAVAVAIAHGVAAAAADGGVVAVACDGDGLLLPLLLRHFAECHRSVPPPKFAASTAVAATAKLLSHVAQGQPPITIYCCSKGWGWAVENDADRRVPCVCAWRACMPLRHPPNVVIGLSVAHPKPPPQ